MGTKPPATSAVREVVKDVEVKDIDVEDVMVVSDKVEVDRDVAEILELLKK